jgi:hypothetical protein
MAITTFGLGIGPGVGSLGVGQPVPQTAHPDWFNTHVPNPDHYMSQRLGSDGDPEYPIWEAELDNVFNARALEIFLPEGVELPPASVERMKLHLSRLQGATCTIRISETKGPERAFLPASRRGER